MARHAVILVHGMGEQVPMQTLKRFVDAVWAQDRSLISRGKPDPMTDDRPRLDETPNRWWAKPDELSDLLEQSHIVTESTSKPDGSDVQSRTKVEFFEFYWAHYTAFNKWSDVWPWVAGLLLRKPSQVPKPVWSIWLILWFFTVLAAVAALYGIYQVSFGRETTGWWAFAGTVAVAVVSALANVFVLTRFGDVARYVVAKPNTISVRQGIRKAGVDFFSKIMNAQEDGKPAFDRVTVVAHSLGTIVAYDVMSYLFARHNDEIDEAALGAEGAQPARAALEAYIQAKQAEGGDTVDLPPDEFHPLVDAAREEWLEQGGTWRISDFISLGSPLTHAEFLLAFDAGDLAEDQQRRIYPTCPPTLERDLTTDDWRMCYRFGMKPPETGWTESGAPRVPHYAAMFGYTKWTNIFSPRRYILSGDLISGPVRALFGSREPKYKNEVQPRLQAATDIAVLPPLTHGDHGAPLPGHKRKFMTHNNYWSMKPRHASERVLAKGAAPYHIKVLRDALRIDKT